MGVGRRDSLGAASMEEGFDTVEAKTSEQENDMNISERLETESHSYPPRARCSPTSSPP